MPVRGKEVRDKTPSAQAQVIKKGIDGKVQKASGSPILGFGEIVTARYNSLREGHSWSLPSKWKTFAGIRAFFSSLSHIFSLKVLAVPLEFYKKDNAGVPLLLKGAIASISDKELKTEGILRISPHQDQYDAFEMKVKNGTPIEKALQESPMTGDVVHVKAKFIKRFFLSLQTKGDPLLDWNALKNLPEENRLAAVRQQIPKEKQATFEALFAFLSKVNSNAENQMTSKNLSIVFGPNLFQPPNPYEINAQNTFIATLIEQYNSPRE